MIPTLMIKKHMAELEGPELDQLLNKSQGGNYIANHTELYTEHCGFHLGIGLGSGTRQPKDHRCCTWGHPSTTKQQDGRREATNNRLVAALTTSGSVEAQMKAMWET